MCSGGGKGKGCHRTLALVGVVVVRGGPRAGVVEGSAALAVGAGGVVLALAASVDLLQRPGFTPPRRQHLLGSELCSPAALPALPPLA